MIISKKKKTIRFPTDIVEVLQHILDTEDEVDQNKEHFWVIGLNSGNVIQYIELTSLGIANRALVHPREVFRHAIQKGATAIIVAHNHTSGSITPSADDRQVTSQLKTAGEVIGINLLDHIIIGNGTTEHYSFLENKDL